MSARAREWFEDETFWEECGPFLFPEERFTAAEREVEQVLALVSGPGGTVPRDALDLCCGPGRTALALARRGVRVTGVDLSPALLAEARRRADEASLAIEWVEADMRDFVREDHYELALSMYTSFGYFENPREDAAVLAGVHRSLKPGAAFLLEVMGKEIIARRFRPTDAHDLPDGAVLVERRTVIEGWSRLENVWTVVREAGTRSFTFRLRIYSGQELTDQLLAAGFVDVSLYGGLDGRPYDPDAERLIALARR